MRETPPPQSLFPAPGREGGEDSPRGADPPTLSQVSPSVSGRMNGARAGNISREAERILSLDLKMQTHRCLFSQQRDKYKRVLSSVLLGRWEVSGVPRRVGQAASGITAPRYSPGQPPPPPRPPPSRLSQRASAEQQLCAWRRAGSSDSGTHMSEADENLCTLRSSVPASKQLANEAVPRGGGGCGEPEQTYRARAPGWEHGLGRTSPSRWG